MNEFTVLILLLLFHIYFLLLLYILLDLYSGLCSSIHLKNDWWPQMFRGKNNGEFCGDCLWTLTTWLDFHLEVFDVTLNFIFKKLDF